MNQIYSVREISKYIKNLFDQDYLLNQVSVRGEISGWKDHPSGHLYFNLRDAESTIPVVMFQSARLKGLKTAPREGMKVVVTGSIELYVQGGKYQLYARTIEEDGEGERYREFLKLKAKLEEMGMFDPAYKKPIPKYAMTIGIVTASSGAALQDVIRVTGQRNPYVQLILSPAVVQGPEAPKSIVRAIQKLDAVHPDVMIVGRGGGSYDDLYCFNDEEVARAIFDAETPVISAVGHEVDFTIADFVADYRAATPSQAAEIAAFDLTAFRSLLKGHLDSERKALSDRIGHLRKDVEVRASKLKAVHPKNKVREELLKLSDFYETLLRLISEKVRDLKRNVTDGLPKLNKAVSEVYRERREKTALMAARLQGASPLEKLKNGYGYVSTEKGALKSVKDVAPGEDLYVNLSDGLIETIVQSVKGIES